MITRSISGTIAEMARQMPVLVITGPRQSGKTTLVKMTFPDYQYVNLELPAEREFAQTDPQSFLKRFGTKGLIIDEVQYAPQLFSYIQVYADENHENGQFILTGSQNFNLLQSVSQSLAGRAVIFNLLPFSLGELKSARSISANYENYIYTGFYPRLYDTEVPVFQYYQSYIQTYIERDVRQIINIKDLNKFRMLLKLLSGRVGQLLNVSSLSNEIGADNNTIKSWISVLETAYIVMLVYPYFKNFGKRIIKSPKLYFLDTGIACNLLGITNTQQLETHYLKGELFENMIITEVLKYFYNKGINKQLYFWRDSNGNEIDLIVEQNSKIIPIEIKSGRTINNSFFKGLECFADISDELSEKTILIYGGDESMERMKTDVFSWNAINSLFINK